MINTGATTWYNANNQYALIPNYSYGTFGLEVRKYGLGGYAAGPSGSVPVDNPVSFVNSNAYPGRVLPGHAGAFALTICAHANTRLGNHAFVRNMRGLNGLSFGYPYGGVITVTQ